MRLLKSSQGFTLLEMVWAVLVVAGLSAVYFFLLDSYQERRMSEQAAKVLMLAARTQEEFFARQHYYFDAEISGNGGEVYLTTPDGKKTSVQIPSHVVLHLRAKDKERKAFTGQAFFTGSKTLHSYDSESGKMTTIPRNQAESG
jgi:prepilin-type N-terminal cleavage/methylation domain-containing protein